ncbi:hypothetical protein L0F63_001684 [Massospora cicadina]|nr:hypothetical protein L0F63_001684 [Massospora cicadina]
MCLAQIIEQLVQALSMIQLRPPKGNHLFPMPALVLMLGPILNVSSYADGRISGAPALALTPS